MKRGLVLAFLRMNEPLMYVISGERSWKKSRDENLKARKSRELKGKIEHTYWAPYVNIDLR